MQKTNLFIALTILIHTSLAVAQTTTPPASADIPMCKFVKDTPPVAPCVAEDKYAGAAITDMIFGNQEAFKKLNAMAKVGYSLEAGMVTLLEMKDEGQSGKSVIKYEIILDDCRDTDECAGHVLWTVVGTSDSDGYVTSEKYTNTLAHDLGKEIIDFTEDATQVDVVKGYLHDFGPSVSF